MASLNLHTMNVDTSRKQHPWAINWSEKRNKGAGLSAANLRSRNWWSVKVTQGGIRVPEFGSQHRSNNSVYRCSDTLLKPFQRLVKKRFIKIRPSQGAACVEWRTPWHTFQDFKPILVQETTISNLFGDVTHHSVNTASLTLHMLYNPTESTNMDEA